MEVIRLEPPTPVRLALDHAGSTQILKASDMGLDVTFRCTRIVQEVKVWAVLTFMVAGDLSGHTVRRPRAAGAR